MVLLVAMAGSAVVGVVIEMIAYRPSQKAPRLAALISAIGMSIFLQNLALAVMGPQNCGVSCSIRGEAFQHWPFAHKLFRRADSAHLRWPYDRTAFSCSED